MPRQSLSPIRLGALLPAAFVIVVADGMSRLSVASSSSAEGRRPESSANSIDQKERVSRAAARETHDDAERQDRILPTSESSPTARQVRRARLLPSTQAHATKPAV